jgi:hypothetical protein
METETETEGAGEEEREAHVGGGGEWGGRRVGRKEHPHERERGR